MTVSDFLPTPSSHARLSPSSAHRWMRCPASPWLEAPYPPMSSAVTNEGQDAHQLAALCLTACCDTKTLLGHTMDNGNIVNKKMARAVQLYVDRIRQSAAGHTLLVEHQVPLTPFTGEKEAVGTADAVILKIENMPDGAELEVHDLKYGRGVCVEAKNNAQLALYALGAKHAFSHLADFKRFRMVIHQPRLTHHVEAVWAAETLHAFAQEIKQSAQTVYALEKMLSSSLYEAAVPGKSQCRFCRARRDCPAYAQFFDL